MKLWCLVFLVILPVCAQASSGNLLSNGGFDEDIDGWDLNPFVPEPNARWVSEDALGVAGSGSAEIDNIGVGNNTTQLGLRRCLPAVAGLEYEAGGSARMTEETTGGLPSVIISAHSSSSCNDSPALHTSWLAFGHTHTWVTSAQKFTAPPGTTHILYFVGVTKSTGVDDTLSARFDNLYLTVDDGLFQDRFEAEPKDEPTSAHPPSLPYLPGATATDWEPRPATASRRSR